MLGRGNPEAIDEIQSAIKEIESLVSHAVIPQRPHARFAENRATDALRPVRITRHYRYAELRC